MVETRREDIATMALRVDSAIDRWLCQGLICELSILVGDGVVSLTMNGI